MAKIVVDGYEIPDHVSYSSLSTYLDCGWMYILTRAVKVPEKPAWWFIGGNAVHEATEKLDLEFCEKMRNQHND